MGAPVVHFEINAKDGKRAQEFYSKLFDWNIDANNPMNYGMVNTGVKKGINGGVGQVDAAQSSLVTFYAEVNDPQAYLDKAVSLGGRVVLPVTAIPNMITFAQFADPEGNIVGIVKSEQPQPKPRTRKSGGRKKKTTRGKKRGRK